MTFLKRFSSGNFVMRLESEMIEKINNSEDYIRKFLIEFALSVEDIDLIEVGGDYGIGNLNYGYRFYSLYTGLIYTVNANDMEELLQGKLVIFYGYKPDEDDLEDIKNYFNQC